MFWDIFRKRTKQMNVSGQNKMAGKGFNIFVYTLLSVLICLASYQTAKFGQFSETYNRNIMHLPL